MKSSPAHPKELSGVKVWTLPAVAKPCVKMMSHALSTILSQFQSDDPRIGPCNQGGKKCID